MNGKSKFYSQIGPFQLKTQENCGYNLPMQVSTAEAMDRLPDLIRAMEGGEQVVITDHGKPVAQISASPAVAPTAKRQVILGGMRDRIKLLPGWDDSITEEELFGEEP
jgi:antitoxin (DNA-binding transcriptional repressor) of toxin-antitoxin stability system